MPHIDSLYRMAVRNYRDPDFARDLVQETYKEAWKSFGNYRRGTNCKAWLFRILFRVAGREIKSRNARTEVPLVGISDPKLAVAPKVEAGFTSKRILEILEGMPEDYRTILVLADIEEMKYREIAESLGVPLGHGDVATESGAGPVPKEIARRKAAGCDGSWFMVLRNKECVEFEALLDDFLSDELSVDTNRRMLTHLEKCSGCRSEKSAREELREAMKQAWRSVPSPAQVAEELRRTAALSQSTTRGWMRFAAVAAGLLVAVALHFLFVTQRSREVVDHFQVVAEDHLHCSGHPANPPASSLSGDLAEVGDRLLNHPAAYRLVAAMNCRLDGKTFVHYIFRGDTGLLSLMIEERSPSQALAPKPFRLAANGVELSTSREGALTVTGMTLSRYFVYLVGDDLGVDDTHRIALEIADPLTKALTG